MENDFKSDLNRMVVFAKQNKTEELGALLLKYEKLLRATVGDLATSPTTSRAGVSDAVQNTYTDIIIQLINNKIPNTIETEEDFAKYVATAAKNNLRDIQKQNRAKKRDILKTQSLESGSIETVGETIHHPTKGPATQVGELERNRELRRLLTDFLPKRQAIALQLVKLDEFSIPQAAKRMECTESAVTSLLRTGMKNLRQNAPKAQLRELFASIVSKESKDDDH